MIVFLDIDGVLNSTAWMEQRPLRGFIPPDTAEEAFAEERLDPAAVARVRQLVEHRGASIVPMSSWRHRMPVPEFARLSALYGWADAPVIGATPDISHATRGEEVEAWLVENGELPYICIDDDADFLPHQNHIQTDPVRRPRRCRREPLPNASRAESAMSEPLIVYGVFAQVRLGLDHPECLAVYSTRDLAQTIIDAQEERLRECLFIEEIEIDRQPLHDFWTTPGVGRAIALVKPNDDDRATAAEEPDQALRGMESAFHLLADMPDDAAPDDCTTAELLLRVLEQGNRDVLEGRTSSAAEVIARLRASHATGGLGSLMQSIAREAGGLTDAEAEALERDRTMPTLAEMRANGRVKQLEARLVDAEAILDAIVAVPLDLSPDQVRVQALDHQRQVIAYRHKHARGLPEGTTGIDDLRERVSELESRAAHYAAATKRVGALERARLAWLQDLMTTRGPEAIGRLARLAAGTEYALVCGACGSAISQLAGYVERSLLAHTHATGQCDVCGRAGSVSPSGDWRGDGDEAGPW